MGAIVIRTRFDEGMESAEVATSGGFNRVFKLNGHLLFIKIYLSIIKLCNKYVSINWAPKFRLG